MVSHLNSKVQKILSITSLKDDDLVIDIGSNDGTTLGFYPQNLDLVGIDPTALKFSKYYLSHIKLIPDFFTAEKAVKYFGSKKAKVVTSFSMFYDLEDPVRFASDISSILDPEHGVWVFEQSYMPEMLKMNSYDTICHEHLEYYSLAQIEWIANKANLKILDVELNNVNGGSFSITACVKTSKMKVNEASLNKMREFETASKLSTLEPYFEFSKRIMHSRAELIKFISNAKEEGKKIFGLGASTKGNVLLQYCGLSSEDIISIADVNPDKFGAFCPGSLIPIEDESKILARKPDYLLVLPWHFKEFFFKSNSFKGLKLVFLLPHLEIVEIAK